MFIAIGSARVMAGTECKTVYLNAEKNATAIAGLFLFVNLLNMLRPIEIFGAFFITIFKMIVTDLFRFSVVYLSMFLAFLVAIQTLYQSNNHFLEAIVTDSLQNSSDFRGLPSERTLLHLDRADQHPGNELADCYADQNVPNQLQGQQRQLDP